MRQTVLCLFLGACGSESKLGDDLDPAGHVDPGDETTTTPSVPGDGDPEDPTGDPADPTGDTEDPEDPEDTVPPDLTEDEICEKAAALTITLDPYQVPEDGRVVYCHSGSGNGFNYIESDISSCLPHLNHQFDVFPTSGCDN